MLFNLRSGSFRPYRPGVYRLIVDLGLQPRLSHSGLTARSHADGRKDVAAPECRSSIRCDAFQVAGVSGALRLKASNGTARPEGPGKVLRTNIKPCKGGTALD